jgi:flagellar export protein FliJ
MPFVYRLQKILDFRIRKKEEQLLVVQKAQHSLNMAIKSIEDNNKEIADTTNARRTADYRMMESFDKYIHYLWEKAEQLEKYKQEKENILRREKALLMQREKEVNVLEKHRENLREIYLEEEKKAELKMLSEIGSQRHFARSKLEREEQELLEKLEKENEIGF